MKEIINQLKDIMIEAAERDGNHELAKKLRVLRKIGEVICADGKTYKPYKPVEFGKDKVKLKDGRVKITSNIKRINVTDYENIVIIDGKRYRKLISIRNKNIDWNDPFIDVCHPDNWCMINGIEYEELN